eukprot:scaffold10187_cov250-Chaetoceros_neogracile.AAC.1
MSLSSSLSPHTTRRILEHGPPHCVNSFNSTSYSARGSLFSTLTLGSSEGVILATSGVIAHTWPGWASVLAIKRLRLRWIILVDNELYSLVSASFPEILVLRSTEVQWSLLPVVDIVAFNGLHHTFASPLSFGSLYMWDSELSLDQKQWKHWSISRHLISHSTCGGVSDGTTTAMIALHQSSAQSFRLPSVLDLEYPATELSSILSPKCPGLECPNLKSAVLPTIEVHELCPHVYHHQGLFPTSITAPQFRVPYLFNSSKFVVRKLVVDEVLQVMDAPPLLFQQMSSISKCLLVSTLKVPIKILAALITSVVLLTGLSIGGGLDVDKASTAAVLPDGDDLAAELPTTYGVPTISATTNDPSAELPTTYGVPIISATAAELTTSAELLTNDPLTIEPSNWKQ